MAQNYSNTSDFRLKVFYSVAKNLSFTKAAHELFITQPAITKHIHELENKYQTRLFDRSGNRIMLTQAGKLLLEHCEIILSAYQHLEDDMHRLNNEYSGELRLGASTTIAHYIMPRLLAKFTEACPSIKVSLIDSNSRHIEQALLNHDIDLGFVEGVFRHPDLKYDPVLKDELVTVTNTRNMPGVEEITLEKLCQIPLVLRERGSGTLDVIENALGNRNLKISMMNIRMNLGSTESIKQFLQYSNCSGIVSLLAISQELKNNTLRIIEIKDFQIYRNFCLASNKGQNNPNSVYFINFLYLYFRTLKMTGDLIGKMLIEQSDNK